MDVGIKGQLLQYLRQLESSRVLPKKMTTKMIKWCVKYQNLHSFVKSLSRLLVYFILSFLNDRL